MDVSFDDVRDTDYVLQDEKRFDELASHVLEVARNLHLMLTQTVYLSVDFNLGVSQTGFVEFWVEQVSSLGSSVANGVVDATGPTVFQLPIHEHFLSIDVCEHILNFVRFIVACYEDM